MNTEGVALGSYGELDSEAKLFLGQNQQKRQSRLTISKIEPRPSIMVDNENTVKMFFSIFIIFSIYSAVKVLKASILASTSFSPALI